MKFDGVDDYIDFGDLNIVEGISEISVSAWVKHEVGDTSHNEGYVVQHGAGDDVFRLYRESTENIIFDVYGSDTTQYRAIFSDGILDTGWHHLVGVLNDSADTVTVYVDGVAGATVDTMTDVTDASTLSILIGSDNTPTGDMDGLIDDVRIYNRALSDAEILRLYQLGN